MPQGYGHYIENAGSDDLEVLIVLNKGSYQSISLSAWVAANPHLLLATNFRGAGEKIRAFPDARAVHAGVTLVVRVDDNVRLLQSRPLRGVGIQTCVGKK